MDIVALFSGRYRYVCVFFLLVSFEFYSDITITVYSYVDLCSLCHHLRCATSLCSIEFWGTYVYSLLSFWIAQLKQTMMLE